MKIYMIDRTRKLKKIKKALEQDFVVESKEDAHFKMTKNDFVILSDEEGTWEDVDKLKNIIALVSHYEEAYIWDLVTRYAMVDIMDVQLEENDMIHRIKRTILQ